MQAKRKICRISSVYAAIALATFAVAIRLLGYPYPGVIDAQESVLAETVHSAFLPAIHASAEGTVTLDSLPASSPGIDLPDATTRRIILPIVFHLAAPVFRPIPTLPIEGAPVDRPAATNGDLNLALRGYSATNAARNLIDIGGPTDDDAPQLAALFAPPRKPAILAVYRVNDWNWGCGANGCRGAAISSPPVTMIALSTSIGEKLYLPARNAEIHAGGYKALVLYADERRITLKYTREDSPVWGYTVHLEEIGVDPSLLQRYREMDAAGRRRLPALRNGDLVGYAIAPSVKVAVRDTGRFMDPRTRKDWWRGW